MNSDIYTRTDWHASKQSSPHKIGLKCPVPTRKYPQTTETSTLKYLKNVENVPHMYKRLIPTDKYILSLLYVKC